jgi:hypothetical protein
MMRAATNALSIAASVDARLPREFPPHTTVQHYFYAWRDSGVLQRINFELLLQARGLAA